MKSINYETPVSDLWCIRTISRSSDNEVLEEWHSIPITDRHTLIHAVSVDLRLYPATEDAKLTHMMVVDKMGNKYESLIWPGIIVLMGGLFLFGTKHLKRSSDSGTKYLCVVGVGVELLFLSIGMYYMIRAVGF